MLDQLDEYALRTRRVHERHAVASGPRSRGLIDEANAGVPQSVQLGDDVIDAVRDVVNGLAPSREETAYGSIRPERFEEFDRAHERDADTLALEGLRRGTGSAREELEVWSRGFDRFDSNRHVIEWPARP